ncbi:heparinase II/III family protein [Mycolicibacterium goodii]|uniref:Heparinase II/III-like C-terminal domain-containing protein n=1 Tax=Mycolicibacterium goodii TaxID=134601 RepID=A0A0K0XDG2_MYCGD|nr:hypothetical protein AFA91_29830 [Mycolicibacterium goodii]
MTLHTTLRAAARLTPQMAVHQTKRLLRNRVVPALPDRYARMVEKTADRLPLPASADRIPPELASFIGRFYQHSELDIRDAGEGRFTLLGRTVDFGSIAGIDWAYELPEENDHHLWRMKLCQLEVLHSLLAGTDPAGHQTARALLKSFAHARSFAAPGVFSVHWSPYGASHRLLAVLSGLSIGSTTGSLDAGTRSEFQQFARQDAAFLWRNIEHDLRNNHTERNLAALCLYHLAAGSISRSRARRLDRDVRRIIDATVLADGMQIERSAMYQGLTVMSLQIFAACPFLSSATRTLAQERAGAATGAWLFLTHRDGDIALFNDSWLDEVPAPATLLCTEGVRLPPSLPEAGYFRLSSGSVDAILDAGEIGPRWNPGHGHADFLAIEVDVDGNRLIVDPGTSQYSTGPQRIYERSAASHNGPRFRDVEPVEYAGCFKVGKLNHAAPIPEAVQAQLPVESIGGTISTTAGTCTRIVSALAGGGLLIVDMWRSGRSPGATTLLIPSDWRIETYHSTTVRARLNGTETAITVYEGAIDSIDEKTWSRRYMRPEPATAVMLVPARAAGGDQTLVFGIGVGRPEEVATARAGIGALVRGDHPSRH